MRSVRVQCKEIDIGVVKGFDCMVYDTQRTIHKMIDRVNCIGSFNSSSCPAYFIYYKYCSLKCS